MPQCKYLQITTDWPDTQFRKLQQALLMNLLFKWWILWKYLLIIHHLKRIRWKTHILPSNFIINDFFRKAPNFENPSNGTRATCLEDQYERWNVIISMVNCILHLSLTMENTPNSRCLKALISHSVEKSWILSTIFSSQSLVFFILFR